MLDLGWQELALIAAVVVLVVGPKDLPGLLRATARTVARARRMAGEFQSSIMEVADQEEIREVRRALDDVRAGRIEAFGDPDIGDGAKPAPPGPAPKRQPAAARPARKRRRAAARPPARPAGKAAGKKARKPAGGKAAP